MNENEKSDFKTDMQEAQQQQSKRTDALDAKLAEQAKEQQAALEALVKRTIMLEVKLQQIDPESINNLATKLDQAITGMWNVCDRIKAFPKKVITDVNHRFEGRNRILVIVIAASIIITAVSLGLWANTFRGNTRLRENDIKYRYLQLSKPSYVLSVDSLFSNNADGFEKDVRTEESRLRALAIAEAAAREKQQETKEANDRVIKLKLKLEK